MWEATTGSVSVLPAYEQKDEITAVPLKLAPYESVFVVFRRKAGPAKENGVEANYPQPTLQAEVNGPWTVTFDPAQQGPEQPVVFETLQDWTASPDERIKYYSGTAFYSGKFNLDAIPEGEKIYIDLGGFTAMAKVSVNGKYAGGLWTAPYQLDITSLVKAGENELMVEVVNTWINRLIGDMNLPEQQRTTWCTVNPYKAGDPLQPSGMFGPVKIVSLKHFF